MNPAGFPSSSRTGLLADVLEEYMRRRDRGEAVDRQQLLAQHPDLADDLRSYFAACDEVEQFGRRGGAETPEAPASHGLPPTGDLETPASAPCPRRVGDYELLESIGQGGMGVIYKARQLSLQRLVAVKMIRRDRLTSPADVLRFHSEAEAAASLDHPNIVPIYEVGEHEGEHYFSMKLLEGGSLNLRLPQLSANPAAAAVVVGTVARAVHYAHQRGILHRDLKPANILLDAEGRPHVTDFGLAKRLTRPGLQEGEASLTQKGLIVGTPNYMAPEQADPMGAVSTAADVYSLGAILYELLTGRPPFRAETPLDTIRQLLEQEPAPPRSLNRRVDRDLETICLKCLHKEPGKRYASAEALADDLRRYRQGEPVRARPVSRRERLLKWVRRRPALAALVMVLVIVVVAGIAGVIWQWRRAEGEYEKAAAIAEAERRTAYARAVALAYAEWRDGNAGPAEQVLDDCRPELRDWEWHYLRRLFQARQLATWKGHADAALGVAFSPDGARVASAGADGVVKVWDPRAALGEPLTLRGYGASVRAVAFSPDSRRLASGDADGTVRVWDVNAGEGPAVWEGHAAGITGLAFDPSGRRLASTGGEPSSGELKLWDATNGTVIAGRTSHNLLAAVCFSPDGRTLVTAGHDGVVAMWDPANLDPAGAFKGRTERIVPWTSVAFSADGAWVAAGSPAGLVRVWDAETTEESFSTLTPAQAGVSGLAFGGEDGRILAAAATDNTIQGWFTRSGKPAFTLRGHRRAVTAVAFSPDGQRLASASEDATVKLWDVGQRDEDLTLRPGNEGATAVAFSPNGARLASAARDRVLKVWDVETGKAVIALRSLPEAVNGLAFSPDGRCLAAACDDGLVRLWDADGGAELQGLGGGGGPVHAVAFSPDGGMLAAACDDGEVRVWAVPSGEEKFRLGGHGGPVHAVAFSPNGRRLASAGDDGVVRVWDAGSGHELLTLRDHVGPVRAVAFSFDGRRLATAGQDAVVRVWDASTGALAAAMRGHAGVVRSLAFSPSGRLASAGDDKVVRLWDAAGQELLALRGHTETVRSVAFDGDGRRMATASDDTTIKIWDGTPLKE
jgi:WD40 repeat protein/tRNA A-37 threonylcarbamoyl transferase component Bud32